MSMRICYALDRDETVETSNGPVPLSFIRRLGAGRRRSGFASWNKGSPPISTSWSTTPASASRAGSI